MEFQDEQKYEEVQMSNEEKLNLLGCVEVKKSQLMNTTDFSTTITPYIESIHCGVLQSFDDGLKTRTLKVIEKVMVEGPSIDSFVTFVVISYEVSKSVFSQLKEHKSKKFTETDHTCAKDYFEYTHNILSFCSDLTKALRAARDRHRDIEHMTSTWTNNMKSDMKSEDFKKILEDLKNLKDSEAYDLSCKNLFTKLTQFRSQQENMFINLKKQMELQSEEKKTDGRGRWRNVLRGMIGMGYLIGCLIVSIAEVIVNPVPKTIASLVVNGAMVVEEAGDWLNSFLNAFKKHVPSTQTETLIRKVDTLVSRELQDIERLINDLVSEIDSVVESVEYATAREYGLAMEDVQDKLDKFLEKIKEFEGILEDCVSKIREARDELIIQFKKTEKKGSCSIL